MESGRANLDNSDEASSSSKEIPPAATYKTIPDQDVDWRKRQAEDTSMSKNNGEKVAEDGVQDKVPEEQSKVQPNKDATEVKFSIENGDTKIDIETVRQRFCGMGKEELMKFANNPFWVRLRWILFISFWLVWLAMFGGAVAIIVLAPKCSLPEQKHWYEESPIIQLEIADSPSKNLKGFESVLDDLKDKHIKGVFFSSILKESTEGHVEDFKNIQPRIGQLSDLELLIKMAEERDQNVILEIDPNHSSENHTWFKQSVLRKEPYTSYYVWADGKVDSDGQRHPPNDWLSSDGESAWEWNENRGQYYYHRFNKTQPDFNYSNSAVIDEFSGVLRHWMNLGVMGFYLPNTAYLTEDPLFRNEYNSSLSDSNNVNQPSMEAYTRDRPENAAILTRWRELVANMTYGEGLFVLQDDVTNHLLIRNEEIQYADSQFSNNFDDNFKAETLLKNINNTLNQTSWPMWNINGKNGNLRNRVPANVADSLTLMTLLLNGTPILKYEDTSAKEAFAKVAKERSSSTFLYGNYEATTINNEVFVYTRTRSGEPGYIVAYHSGNSPTIMDLSKLPHVPNQIHTLAYSPNYVQKEDLTKLFSNQVPISPKSTLVLTFAWQS